MLLLGQLTRLIVTTNVKMDPTWTAMSNKLFCFRSNTIAQKFSLTIFGDESIQYNGLKNGFSALEDLSCKFYT